MPYCLHSCDWLIVSPTAINKNNTIPICIAHLEMGAVIHRSGTGCKWLTLCHNISSQKYTNSVSVIHQKPCEVSCLLLVDCSPFLPQRCFPKCWRPLAEYRDNLSNSSSSQSDSRLLVKTVRMACWTCSILAYICCPWCWSRSNVCWLSGPCDCVSRLTLWSPSLAYARHSSWGSIFSVLTQKCDSFMSGSERHPLNDPSWWSNMDTYHSAGLLSSAQCCFCLKIQYIMIPHYCPSRYLEAVFQNDWKSIELLCLS